jgi:phytoene/squalene synthetase
MGAAMTLTLRERLDGPGRGAPMTLGADVDRAYRTCVRITRHEAANFFYGISLLPRPKRWAMCAAYAFTRRVDDIGDGQLGAAEKLAALAVERERLARLQAGEVGDGRAGQPDRWRRARRARYPV